MAEIEKTLVTIGINYICDNERCKGEVLPSGITGENNKDIVLYQHRCNKCDKIYVFKCHYPKIEYI
jgi:hypothetical protein|tara:strand:- start:209 stop:406 length:198 start_codon:yes stop_codon:yes gene_type:complete